MMSVPTVVFLQAQEEFTLLGRGIPGDLLNSFKHQVITAPLFTRKVYEVYEADKDCQYGVLGSILEIG